MLTIANHTMYWVLLCAPARPNSTSAPVMANPYTTMFARPQRSASPAPTEANAPSAKPTMDTVIR